MKKWMVGVAAGLWLMLLVIPVFAQNQPSRAQTQPAVLNALGERVGVSGLGLGSLVSWNWFYGTYAFVVSQGCTGAPASAPGGDAGGWQRYILNYKGTEYIYLISDNAQNLVLCNEAALGTPVPTITPVPTQPATPTPPPLAMMTSTPAGEDQIFSGDTACSQTPRLAPGLGRVLPGDPNWLHAGPERSSAKVGEIPAGAQFIVVTGPVCDVRSGMNYWQVQFNNLSGWTSEGLDATYWLEPVVSSPPFLVENAARTVPAGWITGQFPTGALEIAFSRDATLAAVIALDGTVGVYDYGLQGMVNLFAQESPATHIAISHDGRFMATSHAGSRVDVWDVTTGLSMGYAIHGGDISAMAFSPVDLNVRVLAVGNKEGQVWLWAGPGLDPDGQPQITLQASGDVAALEFDHAGTLLLARSSTGSVVGIWEVLR